MSAYKPKNTSEEYLLNECRRLERENQDLRAELKEQKLIVARAKDARPVSRSSFTRVLKLVRDACMDLSRRKDGWWLEFGGLSRKFKRLNQVWDLFTAEDWVLSEIFTPVTWELVTTDGLGINDIFINEQVEKFTAISLPAIAIKPPVIDANLSNEEKIKLIEKSAIALTPSMRQNMTDFTLEQITSALGYYKASINKGKEIKSAAGWLLKCLKEEWYKNFVPESPAYTPKIFTASDLPDVEVAPFPKNFWEMARSNLNGKVSDRLNERLDDLVVPF